MIEGNYHKVSDLLREIIVNLTGNGGYSAQVALQKSLAQQALFLLTGENVKPSHNQGKSNGE